MTRPTVTFKREQHRNLLVLSIYMPKDDALNATAKKLDAKYSVTKKMWWLPFSKEVVNKAFVAYKDVAWVDYSAISTKRHSDRPKGAEESKTGQTDVSTALDMTKTAWTPEQKEVQPVGFHK